MLASTLVSLAAWITIQSQKHFEQQYTWTPICRNGSILLVFRMAKVCRRLFQHSLENGWISNGHRTTIILDFKAEASSTVNRYSGISRLAGVIKKGLAFA